MASRAIYTDEQKAQVYVALTANDGNVKRTARETGVPEGTVRTWKNLWKTEPPPPEKVEEAASDFIGEAELVRNMALERIKSLIPHSEKLNELNNTVGILTDKIDRVKLPGKQVDHVHHLPPAAEIREVMAGFVRDMRQMSSAREEEIIDAEIVERKALPAAE